MAMKVEQEMHQMLSKQKAAKDQPAFQQSPSGDLPATESNPGLTEDQAHRLKLFQDRLENVPPFFMAASSGAYYWGECEIDNPLHSDFWLLK